MGIAENLQRIREDIAAAAKAVGRRPEEITLVGASKMNDAAACQEAIAAGIDALGENKVQELLSKYEEGAYRGAPLHFIGHLQRNKVRQIVGKVDLIQSVGSVALLEEIDRRAQQAGVVQKVLLEVNIGGEASKSGFAPQELMAGAEQARTCDHVQVLGLMAIPPIALDSHGNLPYFEAVSRLYVDINKNLYDNDFVYLSMGMSDDFGDAIAAGANMVRIGSAIFGARYYA